MKKYKILIVDDEPGMLEVCADTLGYLPNLEILLENNSLKAAERLQSENIDILLTDFRMPKMNGVELLSIGRKKDPELPALIMTAFPSVDNAIEAMKLGAVDYIIKPFLPDDLFHSIQRLIQEKKLKEENSFLQRQIEKSYESPLLIGSSDAMKKVEALIAQIASSNVDVLIQGETGTGKELIARAIHAQSKRKSKKFVPVDCGAIPENLMESEFFGYEKGAFTGAAQKSIGLMEFANQGTFFLDEIGELPLLLQAKLLRVLQERQVRRVGGKEEISLDVRVVAATRQNLHKALEENWFREDLYFRISVVKIELPPLRERGRDVLELAEFFLEKNSQDSTQKVTAFSDEVQSVFLTYDWPGNVRELQNIVRRGITLSQNTLFDVDDLPPFLQEKTNKSSVSFSANNTPSLDFSLGFLELKEAFVLPFEKEYFEQLLSFFEGDARKAMEASKLPKGSFYRLLKKHNLQPKKFQK